MLGQIDLQGRLLGLQLRDLLLQGGDVGLGKLEPLGVVLLLGRQLDGLGPENVSFCVKSASRTSVDLSEPKSSIQMKFK